MSVAEQCLKFCDLYEAELLLELMLRYWNHPFADDKAYRVDLLEDATRVLQQSAEGVMLIKDIPPAGMNFVAAVWYVESNYLSGSPRSDSFEQREAWAEIVRRSIPSCFANPDDLTTG